MKELIEVIKANPGKYSFAAPGVGSTPHLSGEIFRLAFGLDLPTVQFTGAGPAIQSTLGGHTPVAFSALPPAAPQIKEGLLRGLAVTAEKRSAALPDVPTMAEAGIAGQEAYTLTGILAPAATPKEIVVLLHREIVKLVAEPDVQKRLADLGFEVVANSPEEFAVQHQDPRWKSGARSSATPRSRSNERRRSGARADQSPANNEKGRPEAALCHFQQRDETIRPKRSWPPWSACAAAAPSAPARRHR